MIWLSIIDGIIETKADGNSNWKYWRNWHAKMANCNRWLCGIWPGFVKEAAQFLINSIGPQIPSNIHVIDTKYRSQITNTANIVDWTPKKRQMIKTKSKSKCQSIRIWRRLWPNGGTLMNAGKRKPSWTSVSSFQKEINSKKKTNFNLKKKHLLGGKARKKKKKRRCYRTGRVCTNFSRSLCVNLLFTKRWVRKAEVTRQVEKDTHTHTHTHTHSHTQKKREREKKLSSPLTNRAQWSPIFDISFSSQHGKYLGKWFQIYSVFIHVSWNVVEDSLIIGAISSSRYLKRHANIKVRLPKKASLRQQFL